MRRSVSCYRERFVSYTPICGFIVCLSGIKQRVYYIVLINSVPERFVQFFVFAVRLCSFATDLTAKIFMIAKFCLRLCSLFTILCCWQNDDTNLGIKFVLLQKILEQQNSSIC